MNPAVLSYLQAQQQQMQNPDIALQPNMSGQSPITPMPPTEELLLADNNNRYKQPNNNPFDVGINRAIASARESLSMTNKQQDKALRSSMLAFANNIAQQPKQRGFLNNLGSVGRSLSPAISAYDAEESNAFRENNALANQILAHRRTEQALQAQEEERAWRRNQHEEQLKEQKRYHDMMYGLKAGQTFSKQALPEAIKDLGFVPIQSKTDLSKYAYDKKTLGTALKQLNDLEKKYENFRTNYQGNLIDPMSPLAPVANPVKDLFGKYFNNKGLRTETAARKALNSQLNKFSYSSERSLKGGGILGPTIIKLFQDAEIYPSLKNDTPEDFRAKLKGLKDELEDAYKASSLSLQYKVHIDPYDLQKLENTPTSENVNMQPQESTIDPEFVNTPTAEWILMTDPDTGEQREIYFEDVPKALESGLIKNE